jgi:hypothetical protein
METKNRQLILNFFALFCRQKAKKFVRLNRNCSGVLSMIEGHFPELDSLPLLCYFCKNFHVFSRLCPESQLFARTTELMNCYVAASAEET